MHAEPVSKPYYLLSQAVIGFRVLRRTMQSSDGKDSSAEKRANTAEYILFESVCMDNCRPEYSDMPQ
jgi:hypothetical protein